MFTARRISLMAGEKGTPEQTVQRARWATQAESTLSLIGYSVGPANFWRFPYLCMRNGGGKSLLLLLFQMFQFPFATTIN